MWVVAKIKIQELNIFKKKLIEKLGKETQFYHPKIEYHKYLGHKVKRFEKLVLENYIFCHSKKFEKASFINEVRFLKGLVYFLRGNNYNQNEIEKFIAYCKGFENEKGYITQAFFKTIIIKKAKFISGPFTNMIFEVIERQKDKLKILVGNIVTTISDKTNYLYRPI